MSSYFSTTRRPIIARDKTITTELCVNKIIFMINDEFPSKSSWKLEKRLECGP